MHIVGFHMVSKRYKKNTIKQDGKKWGYFKNFALIFIEVDFFFFSVGPIS